MPSRHRQLVHALERALADEPGLPHVHRPRHAQLGGRVVGHRVLAQVDVPLLQAQQLERIEPVRPKVPLASGIGERRPQLGTSPARMVQFERELAGEPAPDRPARHAGHRDVGEPRIGHVDRLVGEPLKQVPCMRAGHVDRAPLRRAIEQVHLEVEPVGEVPKPGLGPARSAGRRGEEPLPRAGASEQPVVHHVAGLVQREHVSRATHRQVVGTAREHAVDQRVGVGPGDRELAERADVHQAHPLAHRAVLLAPIAVAERPQPPTRPIEPGARRHVEVVERRALVDDLVHAGGERLQGHRPGRGPRRRAGHIAHWGRGRRPAALSGEARQRPAAHRPLARAHRRGRVPLQGSSALR